MLSRIQTVINNHTLAFMCEEPRAEVLIPQHHLLYESKFNIESCNIPYNGIVLDANYIDIRRMHEQLHTPLNHFWERYQNERAKGIPTL